MCVCVHVCMRGDMGREEDEGFYTYEAKQPEKSFLRHYIISHKRVFDY